MRKILASILAILLVCAMPMAALAESNAAFYHDWALALAQEIGELAQSDYVEWMGASDEVRPIVAEVGAQDYSEPETVYLVQAEGVLQTLIQLAVEEAELDLANIPESVQRKLNASLLGGALASMWNGRQGVSVLAATSMLTAGRSYLQPEDWKGDAVALLLYEGDYSIVVGIYESGEGVVSANASVVKNTDELDAMRDSDAVQAAVQEFLPMVEINWKTWQNGAWE